MSANIKYEWDIYSLRVPPTLTYHCHEHMVCLKTGFHTVVNMEIAVFWNVILYSFVDINVFEEPSTSSSG
jgi:hypothetical protein